jgi:LuxR family maltose regulon positive regulatory protein
MIELNDRPSARVKAAEARRHLARLLTHGVLGDRYQQLATDLARYGGSAPEPNRMALTEAEMRILQLLPTHLTLGQIADDLHVSRHTVKSHVVAVYRKLNASTRAEAVREGRLLGIIEG